MKTFFLLGIILFVLPVGGKTSDYPNKLKAIKWVSKEELKKRKSLLSTPIVHRKLQRIYRILNKKGMQDSVLSLIKQLEQTVHNRPFELARLYRLKAQIYSGKEDIPKALVFYQKALSMEQLPYKEHLAVLLDMAGLYLFQDHISEAEHLVDRWFSLTDEIVSTAYILKATILVEKNQKKMALDLVMKAIQNTTYPKESWLAFSASLAAEMGHYSMATKILEKLVANYPDRKQYWKYLSAVYLNIKKNERSLASLDLAYKLNFLNKEREILHLVGLLMYQGQPFKAGQLIQKAIQLNKVKKTHKNYEILGDCLFYSGEISQSLKAYQLSAKFAKDGNIFAKIGRIYVDQEKWNSAVKYFQSSLSKGDLERPEYSYISLGIAYFYLKQYPRAIQSFEQVITATKAKGHWIKTAREWINYTNRQTEVL